MGVCNIGLAFTHQIERFAGLCNVFIDDRIDLCLVLYSLKKKKKKRNEKKEIEMLFWEE